MSVQSSSVVCDSSPALATSQPEQATDVSFDAHRVAWVARGRQHDRAMKRKMRIAAVAAAFPGLLVAVFFGLTAGAR